MGQMTASGIWYPDDSDPSDLKSLLSTQASSVENAIAGTVSDSGWIDLPTNSGFAPQGNGSPQIRKIGKTVKMRWGWNNTGMAIRSAYSVSTIPTGFRPSQSVYGMLGTSSAWTLARGIIYTSGELQITTGDELSSYFLFSNFNWEVD